MASSLAPGTGTYAFDDRNIKWQELPGFEHFVLSILDVNVPQKTVDFILKFVPNEQIFLHSHLSLTNTFVVQGEHRLYEPDGSLREVRPTGMYTSSPPGSPHREGGGPEGAVVFYSLREKDGALFEVVDDDLKVVGTLGMQDFVDLLQAQHSQAP